MVHELTQDFREFVELLNSHKVSYIIIGAWALAFHGEPRLTGDFDVLVDPKPENAKNLMEALKAFGFGGVGLSESDFIKPGNIVQLGYKPNRIDILTSITGVEFSTAWSGRSEKVIAGLKLVFLGRDALITNKRATGRDKDLSDARSLERMKK